MPQQSQPEIADTPEVRALVSDASTLLAQAQSFAVATAEDYIGAAEQLKSIKAKQKELKGLRETITKPMRAALDAVRALFAKPEERLGAAEDTLKGLMSAYDDEQDRQRQEAQRKLDEEAERQRKRLEAQAAKARAAGNADKAADLTDRAAMTFAPIAQQQAPAVAGIARRQNWHAEVTDLRALVRAVAEGRVPLTAIEANRTFLNSQARALRDELRYPGVRALPERTIAAGSA
jgi:hypothetical protein